MWPTWGSAGRPQALICWHEWVSAAGAQVGFKTHLDDGDWTGVNGEQGIGAAAG